MTEAQIKQMVDRFLSWKLPENFNPDGGVSFTKLANEGTPHQHKYEPSGTNLLDATQADAMVRHMLDGLPRDDFRWLIEAPGPRYLTATSVRRLVVAKSDEFEWSADHDKALAFRTEQQADAVMMALRQMDRAYCNGALFAFEATLGNAKPVEHGWIDAGQRFGKRVGEMLSGAAERINAAR